MNNDFISFCLNNTTIVSRSPKGKKITSFVSWKKRWLKFIQRSTCYCLYFKWHHLKAQNAHCCSNQFMSIWQKKKKRKCGKQMKKGNGRFWAELTSTSLSGSVEWQNSHKLSRYSHSSSTCCFSLDWNIRSWHPRSQWGHIAKAKVQESKWTCQSKKLNNFHVLKVWEWWREYV